MKQLSAFYYQKHFCQNITLTFIIILFITYIIYGIIYYIYKYSSDNLKKSYNYLVSPQDLIPEVNPEKKVNPEKNSHEDEATPWYQNHILWGSLLFAGLVFAIYSFGQGSGSDNSFREFQYLRN
uniref:Uncharacterized protein n=1 Tax=Phlegmariurus squarrosus TaxID=73615 RepID=H9M854_PHLSQ|nr:hypothetical protein HusqMp63 [Phlegmariurus squarrosus]AEV55761.1 hypothetical protein HusqMp63 [Phlegmariurus squarrosus]